MKLSFPKQLDNFKYKIFILPALTVLISVLLIVFIIYPRVQKTLSAVSENEKISQQIVNLSLKAEQLKNIDTEAFNQNLQKVFLALPADKDIPTSVSQVQFLATAHRLQITNLAVANTIQPGSPAQYYQIRLEVVGDIQSIKSFIQGLRQAPRVMSVASIALTGSDVASAYQVNMIINSYFQTDQTTLGKLDQPVADLTVQEQQILATLDQAIRQIPLTQTGNLPTPEGKSNPFE